MAGLNDADSGVGPGIGRTAPDGGSDDGSAAKPMQTVEHLPSSTLGATQGSLIVRRGRCF